MKLMKLTLAGALALAAAPAGAKTYEIDASHSAVSFKIAHLVVSKVSGRFQKFSGSVDYEKGKPQSWAARADIDAASVDTNSADRDKHLRGGEFFDVEKHPEITFKSVRAQTVKGKTQLIGDLSIHGVTKRVALDLEVGGLVKDPWGGERLGAVGTTKINRKDFGLTWNTALEAGGVAVGEEVEITLEIEAVAKKS